MRRNVSASEECGLIVGGCSYLSPTRFDRVWCGDLDYAAKANGAARPSAGQSTCRLDGDKRQ